MNPAVHPVEMKGSSMQGHASKPTDIRTKEIRYEYEDFDFRAPLKFGGVAITCATLVNVHCDVEPATGRVARGFGSMPLGNVWSFPSKKLGYDDTLNAMKALVEQIAQITGDYREAGHPIDLTWALEPAYLEAAREVSRRLNLSEPIPHLCTLVAASAFDAALHDAFGKAHGLNSYHTYGSDFMTHDLSQYLGAEFKGEYLDRYIHKEPRPRMPMYHLVGALDPLEDGDVRERIGDGLPETLREWITADGLTHLKIKLNGDNLDWDVDRVVRVDRAAGEVQKQRGVEKWVYSLDFNEKCPHVGYLLDFLNNVRVKTPAGFERIQYIEQPTARDLKANRKNTMHDASKLRPVVIDESLLDLESLVLAHEMGYTGAALKACKGQSQSLLMAAAAHKMKLFLCVQDLTCPGASLLHSAGLAAHVPGVAAIESNARQYMPAANRPWEKRFPGIFRITDGTMETGLLTGPGLGVV
jgi:L-alanine-DL-glutamate epimerase-like enolase superfamily enzyme